MHNHVKRFYSRKTTLYTHFHSVKLSDTIGLVLLLDGVVVGGFLGGVDQLVGQALSDRLDVTECGLSEGSHVDGLTTNGTGASNTSRVPLSEELDLGKIALELKGGSKAHGLVYCPFVAKKFSEQ
ncbi:hypothetical protein PRIPAC_95806 [Pristionchus pacificus]|uniref:Uncharacterized protein n=1 Tax=Pristionchus pacificus TaxID=54126 RepID=A0A2A6BBY3_PRIPA|nr:hypothetical protein PRIPAC_95806 [Pristionchus pacificus]|eukprot:PDM63393.1 hypothetical protein PRIPAC_53750 [Pristionchus pacificus]